MDENITNEVETVETTDSELDAAFDEVWNDTAPDDDDFDLSDDGAEGEPDAQPEEPEAAEETEQESDSSDGSGSDEPEATEGQNDGEENQLFTLKVNGEDKKVTLAEITELAQKGSDYDRVKQERDAFKQDAPTIQKYKVYEAFLKELAEGSNTDIENLIDGTRARLLMSKAEDSGETLSQEDAMARAKAMRKPAEDKSAEPATEQPADPEAANRKMLMDFLVIYPDVEPESIPKRVWDESNITGDLVGAYQRYENRQLKEQIATLKQNNKNKERSTGSRRTAGATTPKDAFDEGWDSDF